MDMLSAPPPPQPSSSAAPTATRTSSDMSDLSNSMQSMNMQSTMGLQSNQQLNSGLSTYSPISTLERQYTNAATANSPLPQRIFLFIQANAHCCIEGGVEAVLRHPSQRANASSSLAQQQPPSSMSLSTDASAEAAPNAAPGDNPFAFLSEEDQPVQQQPRSSSGGGGGFGRFFKKVASSSSKALERGMHSLAVRADQGRNPDWLTCGLYGGDDDKLQCCTEAQPLPSDAQARLKGVGFCIPICLSTTMQSSSHVVTLRLWIRSGATLLQQTKAARNYLLGSAMINLPELHRALQQQKPLWLELPLQSVLVTQGSLSVLACSDLKHPALCGYGWSLVDPNPTTGYLQYGNGNMLGRYNWPLDQSYAFPLLATSPAAEGDQAIAFPPARTLIATERSTESTVVVPIAAAFAKLASAACRISQEHAESWTTHVLNKRHDTMGNGLCEYADISVQIGYCIVTSNTPQLQLPFPQVQPLVTAAWQRPDSIFEVDLLAQPVKLPLARDATGFTPVTSFRFFPKPCRDGILPSLVQQYASGATGGPPTGFWLGNLRLQLIVSKPFSNASSRTSANVKADNPFAPAAAGASGMQQNGATLQAEEYWECIIPLEALVLRPPSENNQVREFVLKDPITGATMGLIGLSIGLEMFSSAQQQQVSAAGISSAKEGLTSLVGLTPLNLCQSGLDFETFPVQQQQPHAAALATMGSFVTHAYMHQHANLLRLRDTEQLERQASAYAAALLPNQQQSSQQQDDSEETPLELHQDRSPKAFRPSSSRPEVLLSGLPFNVHTATLSCLAHENPKQAPSQAPQQGEFFYNTTCGAPADHARDFGNVFAPKCVVPEIGKSNSKEQNQQQPEGDEQQQDAAAGSVMPTVALNSPIGPASGGLRRLESKRQELAQHVAGLQTYLVQEVGMYFQAARRQQPQQTSAYKANPTTHVPARHYELQTLRWRLFEAVQSLHHLTWLCAARRANVFSQALGIATSAFLTSVSDPAKWQPWPELWARHGFLISFEGLLSAAGKELGMIEDASVGIRMLHMVRVVLVEASDNEAPPDGSNRFAVPCSPYLKWICLTSSITQQQQREFVLQIGIVPSYYAQRIPPALKTPTGVRLYPLLFEVGVDIRQWGANVTGGSSSNATSSASADANKASASSQTLEAATGEGAKDEGLFLDTDDEDEGGDGPVMQDDDVLVQLNYEAFQRLNTYAHFISPANSLQATNLQRTSHPLLETLYQHIASSSGKMNHDILLEAATLVNQLGGSAAVFCKSGKDRTAMHVTLKQAQFANQCKRRQQKGSGTPDTTARDATLIRIHGTRLPICEKNVGQALYAFNSLQVKFMPQALQPPMNTLAGFLKGGRVFTGGAIES